ncbi:MAG: methyltransferase [Bacteroidales bacterium]|nr:methyltransferase [Bacteroidales bacterium]
MSFQFRNFFVCDENSALKVGTDAVLLGAAMTLPAKKGAKCLDIGTGCGVIALMASQRCDGAHIVAIDIDEGSIADARLNFSRSPWPERLTALHSSLEDFQASLQSDSETFDCIFSNPPFFKEDTLSPSKRKATAKSCRGAGLSYREIIDFAVSHLKTDGSLSLILPYSERMGAVSYAALKGFRTFRTISIRSCENKPFSRIIVEFTLAGGLETEQSTLTINKEGSERSLLYTSLTKEFYL